MNANTYLPIKNAGFSLVEMAVVLVILGFVLAALLLPLQAQRNQLFQTQTENTLEIAKKALIGFAQTRGRLPCPATAVSAGIEAPAGGGDCTTTVGLLPAATLGIQPTDANGFAIDGWNNRIGYAVTQVSNGGAATADFTTSNDMSTVGMATLAPNLRVCASATGITASACSGAPESNYLANNAVAVIYSTGGTAGAGAASADETANLNGDIVFVSHDPTTTFDHIVTWISPYVLYNAMIEAGQLH